MKWNRTYMKVAYILGLAASLLIASGAWHKWG
jgi:hypothetical protein